jgi:hypothetical protein
MTLRIKAVAVSAGLSYSTERMTALLALAGPFRWWPSIGSCASSSCFLRRPAVSVRLEFLWVDEIIRSRLAARHRFVALEGLAAYSNHPPLYQATLFY